jgi:hypothetical protein
MHNTEIQRLMHESATMRGLLLWTLYHHQGGSSSVGQPIRKALGIGEHAHLTADQVVEAKKYGEPYKHKTSECTYEPTEKLREPVTVPDGWQIVPSEPTEEMRRAAMACGNSASKEEYYCAMLKAAPSVVTPNAELRGGPAVSSPERPA